VRIHARWRISMMQSRLMVALVTAVTGVLVMAEGVTAQQPAPTASLAGAYTLAQVDDVKLPALLSEEAGCRREVTAATLTLQADNKWALEATIRETCGEKVAEKMSHQTGSFTATAAALEFKPAEADAAAAKPAPAPAPAPGNAPASAEAKEAVQLAVISAGTIEENTITVQHGEKRLVFRK
jgi:hypothetical protein